MPDFLRKFDHLIFHAGSYRDIDFAREHNLGNYSIVPNGASEEEFLVPPRKNFRATLGIAEDDFLILTVGAPIVSKGHAELAAAFALLRTTRPASLILNGDWPPRSRLRLATSINRLRPPMHKGGRKPLKRHCRAKTPFRHFWQPIFLSLRQTSNTLRLCCSRPRPRARPSLRCRWAIVRRSSNGPAAACSVRRRSITQGSRELIRRCWQNRLRR